MKYLNPEEILCLNINEILLKDEFVNEVDNLKNYLFDCQCIIFLVDITNNDSYLLVKKIINYITNFYPNVFEICRLLLVLNKIDLEKERKVLSEEVERFIQDLNGNNYRNKEETNKKEIIEKIEISAKNKTYLSNLWEKVYQCLNRKENKKIAINSIKERIDNLNTLNYQEKVSELAKLDGIINIVLMGDSGVGKSNFLSMYFHNKFVQTFISTIGIDKKTKIIKYRDSIYSVNISDTAGQERFRSLPLRYFKNAEGILLLYDVGSIDSFKNVERWVEDMKSNEKFLSQKIYVIGNKIDIKDRKVSYEEGEEMAKKLGFEYYEMSCKINMNVFEIISRLIKDCIKKYNPNNTTLNTTLNSKKLDAKKNSCC
jgi:small GTP-binding protein